jgi:hypothetical protein
MFYFKKEQEVLKNKKLMEFVYKGRSYQPNQKEEQSKQNFTIT